MIVKKFLLSLIVLFCSVSSASAAWNSTDGTYTWEPLITASSFTGIFTDLSTAIAGLIAVVLILLGVGLLIRTLSK